MVNLIDSAWLAVRAVTEMKYTLLSKKEGDSVPKALNESKLLREILATAILERVMALVFIGLMVIVNHSRSLKLL